MIEIISYQITKEEYCKLIEINLSNLLNEDLYYYSYEVYVSGVIVDYINLTSFKLINQPILVINHFNVNSSSVGRPFGRLISEMKNKNLVKFKFNVDLD